MTSKYLIVKLKVRNNTFHLFCSYLIEGKNNLYGTSQLIYFCFLILVSLILMNLLIGLAVNDIQGLQKEGSIKRLRKQAEFIVYLEDIASNRFLRWVLCCNGVVDVVKKWINLENVFTFSPVGRLKSSGRSKGMQVVLPNTIVERAVAIVQEGRVPVESMTIHDTYNLMHECVTSIGALRQRIESLERGLIGTSSTTLPDIGSSEAIERSGDTGVSDEPMKLSADKLDDSDHSEAELLKSHKEDDDEEDDGEDHVDGPYNRIARTLSRRTTRTTKTSKSVVKRSMQSELKDIKRMLINLTSKMDISPEN